MLSTILIENYGDNMSGLELWSIAHRNQIRLAVESALSTSQGTPFAVFDADNTIWKHDITEGLLAYMSVRHG